jgi:aminoglycoside/choline kinase family phosphotransferase
MSQNEQIIKLLTKNGLPTSDITQLPADASFRRYYRTSDNAGKTFILVDSSKEKQSLVSFNRVAGFLKKCNISAPSIIDQDLDTGFALIEDFGVDSYTSMLTANPDIELETIMYEHAIDVLLALQKKPADDNILPYYSDELLLEELSLLNKWYIPVLQDEPLSNKLLEEFRVIWEHLIPYTRFIPETTVLRDYMADNLFWLEEEIGISKVGVIDFQDAVIGCPVYDVVSLLVDARRVVNPEVMQEMINR